MAGLGREQEGHEAFRVVSAEPGVSWLVTGIAASAQPRRIWIELERTPEPAEVVAELFASLGIPRST
ncbi:hypothetical protein ACI2IY_05790 [Lysobacter enzymogenes]|uniref:hypothetical protein n=1 Tax=Lysobacter enzymogenes TaxID=69 RepID=UPI00384D07CC